jgi:SAM-dependent methyltransferase
MRISSFINKVNFKIAALEERFTAGTFKTQLADFKAKDTGKRFTLNDIDLLPVLYEATTATNFDAHYIYHPAWATRIVKKINPAKHIDISSTLHFCSQLSAFIPVEFYDYRPAALNLDNLTSGKANLTSLPFADESIASISCMHTIEHVGLGRYGDPLEPDADLKAIAELQRVVQKGGSLLLVTPVGSPRIQFNAHRIYSFQMINELFGEFELVDFSLVTDNREFISPAPVDAVEDQKYGCGCFWYIKKG